MFKTTALVSTLVLAATAAQAQDWTGGYAGVGLGYTSVEPAELDSKGDMSYGLHAGYMNSFSSGFVLGGEVEYDWIQLDYKDVTLEVDNVLRGKVILGSDEGSWMPYAVIGGAQVSTSDGDGSGVLGGLGAAFSMSESVALSAEYLYHDFKDVGDSNLDAKASVFNVRASYRF